MLQSHIQFTRNIDAEQLEELSEEDCTYFDSRGDVSVDPFNWGVAIDPQNKWVKEAMHEQVHSFNKRFKTFFA